MRVMVFVPGSAESEAGQMPTKTLLVEMMNFKELTPELRAKTELQGEVARQRRS